MMGASAVVSWLGRLIEPAERRLLILIYHRVHRDTDELFPREITAETFRWQVDLVARHMSPMPLREGIERLSAGTLPRRAVAVTFDDGYADNLELAAPILRAAGVPATFFIASGYLDGGRMWNDTVIESVRRLPLGSYDFGQIGVGSWTLQDLDSRRELCRTLLKTLKHRPPADRQRLSDAIGESTGVPLPDDLMMTTAQVQTLIELGFDIGGHTVSHPILRLLSDDEARREILDGRVALESITGRPVELFAYPNGRPGEDYGPEHAATVRDLKFVAAVSTRRGVSTARDDRWQLPRFTPWDREPERFLARMLLEFRNAAAA
jgi:peptidoglycan/xylan/chitin deacetylase (PgdA/CDA1 family)